jgi:hypothetical protein
MTILSQARSPYDQASVHRQYLLLLQKEKGSIRGGIVAGEGIRASLVMAVTSATPIQLALTAFPFVVAALFSGLTASWVEYGDD